MPDITEGSNGIQDLLWNFTMGSDWIMDPILQLVERSPGIIDPTFWIHGHVCSAVSPPLSCVCDKLVLASTGIDSVYGSIGAGLDSAVIIHSLIGIGINSAEPNAESESKNRGK